MEIKKVIVPMLVLMLSVPLFTETITYETAIKNVDSLDKGGRWLAQGIKEINEIQYLDNTTREDINKHLLILIIEEELRDDVSYQKKFIHDLEQKNVTSEVIETVNRAHIRVSSSLNLHEGYWVTKMKVPNSFMKMTIINDMHIDAATNRVTVYAQSRIAGKILSPAQINPGETTELPNGDIVGFHPNAVYLNGSGKELTKADGTGEWWVKHSWILGGQGYYNWELKPQKEYGEGLWVEGEILDDGLTMKVGAVKENAEFYNLRKPVIGKNKISYLVTRYAPETSSINTKPVPQFELEWNHQNEKSAFDNLARQAPQIR